MKQANKMRVERNRTIRFFREKLGWPRKQMAAALETTEKTLSLIERGGQKLSDELAVRAGAGFSVAPDWFLANDISRPVEWLWVFHEAPGLAPIRLPEEIIIDLIKWRDNKGKRRALPMDCHLFWGYVIQLSAVFDSAVSQGKVDLFKFELSRSLDGLEKKFQINQELHETLMEAVHCYRDGWPAEPPDAPRFARPLNIQPVEEAVFAAVQRSPR